MLQLRKRLCQVVGCGAVGGAAFQEFCQRMGVFVDDKLVEVKARTDGIRGLFVRNDVQLAAGDLIAIIPSSAMIRSCCFDNLTIGDSGPPVNKRFRAFHDQTLKPTDNYYEGEDDWWKLTAAHCRGIAEAERQITVLRVHPRVLASCSNRSRLCICDVRNGIDAAGANGTHATRNRPPCNPTSILRRRFPVECLSCSVAAPDFALVVLGLQHRVEQGQQLYVRKLHRRTAAVWYCQRCPPRSVPDAVSGIRPYQPPRRHERFGLRYAVSREVAYISGGCQ